MSAPEGGGHAGGGRGQRPSAAPGALPADAASIGPASTRPGRGAVRLAAAAQTPGAARQPPASSSPRAATPEAADAPRAALVALSLLSPGAEDGAAAGGGAPRTRLAAPPDTSHGAGGAASSLPGAGACATSDGAIACSGGVPRQGPATAAASPTPAGDASVPGAGPPEPVGDDGRPLSAEAAANPFSPPASERHAAFLKLVDHMIKAGLQQRHMRQADFSALAAEAGVPLFGGDSIIVARLRAGQALSLGNQSGVEPYPAEKAALRRRAWTALLTQVLPVLQSRMDTGTLLPGRLRKVEEAYWAYELLMIVRVTERPELGAATLQGLSRLMGYDTALHAATTALSHLPLHPWRMDDERGRAQVYMLAALHLIPKTAGLLGKVASELDLVDLIERRMPASVYGTDFYASVLALWRSRAVADVLRSREALQNAAPTTAALNAEFEARQKADLAKRGLRRCALPSCGKQEATVLQFRVCGHCQTTRYCCPEHAKQHWKAHKREYEAEEEGEGGEAGRGGGAAA